MVGDRGEHERKSYVKSRDSGTRLAGFLPVPSLISSNKAIDHNPGARRTWASDLTSLLPHFLLCKIMVYFTGWCLWFPGLPKQTAATSVA